MEKPRSAWSKQLRTPHITEAFGESRRIWHVISAVVVSDRRKIVSKILGQQLTDEFMIVCLAPCRNRVEPFADSGNVDDHGGNPSPPTPLTGGVKSRGLRLQLVKYERQVSSIIAVNDSPCSKAQKIPTVFPQTTKSSITQPKTPQT